MTIPPPAPAIETPTPPPKPGAKPAVWPEWYGTADFIMLVFVALATFLIASFAARNSDFFLHVGTGRLIATGGYSFSHDVLSFTGADRLWVNHSWLYQTLAYFLYKADATGGLIVGVKALGMVVGLGLVIFCRRGGNPLWPWVGFAALSALTMAPHMQLRPIVVSMVFLSATLFVLFKLKWNTGLRNPLILGGLFALWSNLDAWFILGPIAVFLVWLGEILQASLLPSIKDESTVEVPLEVAPTNALLKALAVGIMACMINPHHIHVWEIPAEFGLGFPADIANDNDLRILLLSPASPMYYENESLGSNVNGLAYILLFITSGILLATVFRKVRVSHLLLWIVFAFLGFRQLQLALFFAPVAALLAPAYLNALSSTITLTTWANRKSRMLLTGSGVGRLVCVPLSIAMVAFAWPGWLHPKPNTPSAQRYVQWKVEGEPGLERLALQLESWRTAGLLKPEMKGLNNNVHFGNYCAWYAPSEKVFVNTRYNFHKPELPDYMAFRKALLPSKEINQMIDSTVMKSLVDTRKITYLALTYNSANSLLVQGQYVSLPKEQNINWRVWDATGRSLVVGIAGPDSPPIEYNPIAKAFGLNMPELPPGPTLPPMAPRTWFDDFISPPKPTPIQTDDTIITALLETEYARATMESRSFWQMVHSDRSSKYASGKYSSFMASVLQPTSEFGDTERALAILGLRYARQAVAANPDSPESYLALIDAYAKTALPELWADRRETSADRKQQRLVEPGERTLQRMAAYTRYLARIPAPQECNKEVAARAFQVAISLAQFHKALNHLDAARERFKQAISYYPFGQELKYIQQLEVFKNNEKEYKERKAQVENENKGLKEAEKQLAQEVVNATNQIDRLPKEIPADRKIMAFVQVGLPLKALEEFRKTKFEEYGEARFAIIAGILSLEMSLGKIEEAAQDSKDFVELLDDYRQKNPQQAQQMDNVLNNMRPILYRIDIISGRYADARTNWVQINTRIPKLSAEDKKSMENMAGINILEPEAMAVAGLHIMVLHELAMRKVSDTFSILETEGRYLYNRAIIDLYQGNRSEAKKGFELALAPQGVAFINWPWANNCKQFLKLFAMAEGK